MSLSSQASGYMSSSSSLQTSISSSSLTASSHGPSSLDHHGPPEDEDGWADEDPAGASDEGGEWKTGVSLRKGWEFLGEDGKAVDLGLGSNRLSLAETVKTVTPSVHRSNRSSTERLSTFESPTNTTSAPSPPPPPPPTSTGPASRTGHAQLFGTSTNLGMPSHQEEAVGLSILKSTTSSRPHSPAPSKPPGFLLGSPAVITESHLPRTHSSSSTKASRRRSSTPTAPSALPAIERSTSPLYASIGAWASNVPPSPSSHPRALSPHKDRKTHHHRSVEPAPRRSSVGSLTPSHSRTQSAVSPLPSPAGIDSSPGARGETPLRPHKPRWLQASPSFASSPNLSGHLPESPKARSKKDKLDVASPKGRRAGSPGPLASSSSLASLGEARSVSPPSARTPALPARPAVEVQKQSAEAEFAPSSSSKGTHLPPPSHPASGSTSGRGFTASNGLKGRLAAFSGMVGGAANHLYEEGSQRLATAQQAPATTSPSGGSSNLSYSAYTASTQAGRPVPSAGAPKTSRGFQHALMNAPSSGVKMFNTAWKSSKSSTSASAGAPLPDKVDGAGLTPIMFNPDGSAAPGSEGRVFGKDVVEVARAWGVREGVAKKRGGSVDEACIEGSSIDRVSRENLPALVVRCVEYLEIWGPREEGIFRISGRSTHIVKLRAQLDTGADIDLKLSHAGDLDPHAVASVFKAYLRELPSPILTVSLTPRFDAVMERFTGTGARGGEFVGLPYPKVTQELSTQSEEERKAQLKAEIKDLLAQLPVTCWALLKVVVGLLQHTDRHSKENKMGIPNLLLVLCPSICLSPPFLRLLIEHSTDLFDTPPAAEPSPALAPSPVLPPRPTISTPLNRDGSKSSTGSDAPELDMPRTFPSPLPDFSVTESSPRTRHDGWSTPPLSPASTSSALTPELVALPTSPSGSPKQRKKTSLPTPASAKWDEGDAAAPLAESNAGLLLDQPTLLTRQRKRSIIDLANAAYKGLGSSDKEKTRSDSVASSSASGGPPSARSNSIPEDGQQPEDILPPPGIVAAKKNLFSTPIVDRFKPSFRSHSSKSGANKTQTVDSSGATTPQDASDSSTAVRSFRRPGHGGLFSSSSKASKTPVDDINAGKTSEFGAKKPSLWARGNAAVSSSSTSQVEAAAGKSVKAAVKALEPKPSAADKREKHVGTTSAP